VKCLIEEAWKEGFDKEGAAQLKNKLNNTRKWIGASGNVGHNLFKRVS
jgi:hypothetical protein